MHCSIDDPDVEVLYGVEIFPFDPQEPIYTEVLYQERGQTFGARINERCPEDAHFKYEQLVHKVLIPKEAYQPLYDSTTLTRAEETSQYYVKRPSLLSCYSVDGNLSTAAAEQILHEALVFEILRTKHNNHIATYHGCKVEDGRITGLCITKYEISLQAKLNPGHLGKRMFAESARLDHQWVDKIIAGIADALKLLHSLGYVHNDLNPSNIMLDHDGTPKLIDFGSCKPTGEHLEGGQAGTYEWYDVTVDTAMESNDLNALKEIEAWMKGRTCDMKFLEAEARDD